VASDENEDEEGLFCGAGVLYRIIIEEIYIYIYTINYYK
jgi:hypothetical protein